MTAPEITTATVAPQAFSPAAFGAAPYFPGAVHPFLEMLGWRHYKVRPSIIVDPATCGPPDDGGATDYGSGLFRIRSTYGVYTLAEYTDPENRVKPRHVLLYAPCSAAFQKFHSHFTDPGASPKGMTAEEAGSAEWTVVAAWDADSRQARIENAMARHETDRTQDLKEFGYFYQINERTICNDGVVYMIHPERDGLKRIFCLASLGKGSLPLRTLEPALQSERLSAFLRQIAQTGSHAVRDDEVMPIIRRDAALRAKALFEGADPRIVKGDDYFVTSESRFARGKNMLKRAAAGAALSYGLALKNFNVGKFRSSLLFNILYYGGVGVLQIGLVSKGIVWRAGLWVLQSIGKAASATMNVNVIGGYKERDDRTAEFWSRKSLPSVIRDTISRTIDPDKVPHLRPVRFGRTELRHTAMAVGTKLDHAFGPNYLLDPIQPPGTIIRLYGTEGQIAYQALQPNGLEVLNVPSADMSLARQWRELALPGAEPLPTVLSQTMARMSADKPYFCVQRALVDELASRMANAGEDEAQAACARHFTDAADARVRLAGAIRAVGAPEPFLRGPAA